MLDSYFKNTVCSIHSTLVCFFVIYIFFLKQRTFFSSPPKFRFPEKRRVDRIFNNIYSYFEKGCRIKCTRQPRKVLWVVLSSLFFKEIWKRIHRHMSASAKGKQQKQVRELRCQETCIQHIPYYLSGLSRAHFSDNLSRNSCISSEKMASVFTQNVLGFLTVYAHR